MAIMDIALSWSDDTKKLRRINNVRQTLQVTFLSELCTLDGSRIRKDGWHPKPSTRRKTNLQWPRTGQMSHEDIRQWKSMLASVRHEHGGRILGFFGHGQEVNTYNKLSRALHRALWSQLVMDRTKTM